MPDEETPAKVTKPSVKPAKVAESGILEETVKSETFSEPYTRVLAPNSPWKTIHSDSSINTYALEIVGIGVIVRSESPGTNSESSVFIPNIKIADLPDCK